MPDARRRMLDALAAVSERVDYAGRVHAIQSFHRPS
jgi:hypothetical protein